MRPYVLAFAVLASAALPACNRSHTRGAGTVGVTTICGMLSDPARNLVYVGDAPSGRVIALSAATGDPVEDVSLGNTIGGMALDHCYDLLYVSITGALRIDVLDADTLARVSTLRLGTTSFALAPGAKNHLLAVTGRGFLDLDLGKLQTTVLKPVVDHDAFVCADRLATQAWLAETLNGEATISRVDLGDLHAPLVTTAPGTIAGKVVGLAVDFEGAKVYVGTDGADGIVILDGTTLAKLGTIDVGPGLAAMASNTTGTRMYVSHGDTLVQSLNLDTFGPGIDLVTGEPVRERGLHVAPNNLGLVAHQTDTSLATFELFDLKIDAPTAARQGRTYALAMEGTPDAPWFLFVSLAPGYLYIDPPSSFDPRFFDLSVPDGFALLNAGRFDLSGHSAIVGTIPADYPEDVDFVIQAASLPRRGRAAIEISNPMAVRFLGPDCD